MTSSAAKERAEQCDYRGFFGRCTFPAGHEGRHGIEPSDAGAADRLPDPEACDYCGVPDCPDCVPGFPVSAAVSPAPDDVRCEAAPRPCAWPDCDCDCDCLIPALEGAGQHSPGCRSVKRQAAAVSSDSHCGHDPDGFVTAGEGTAHCPACEQAAVSPAEPPEPGIHEDWCASLVVANPGMFDFVGKPCDCRPVEPSVSPADTRTPAMKMRGNACGRSEGAAASGRGGRSDGTRPVQVRTLRVG